MIFKTLEELNEYFLHNSYAVGYAPSNKDTELFAVVHKHLDAEKYPHLARWFAHLCSFPNKAAFPVVDTEFKLVLACDAPAVVVASTKKEEEEEEEDLFGDDDDDEDDEEAEALAAKVRAEAEKKQADAKKGGKVEKSLLVIDVKPYDESTDLKALFQKIISTAVPGCKWGESNNILPLAYGLYYLQISCVIEDEVCSEEDVIDAIEQFDEEVQSTEVASFNKIS